MSTDYEIEEIRSFHDKAAEKQRRKDWCEQALVCLRAYAQGRNAPFLIEEARRAAEVSGLPTPPDARAWGHVVRVASTSGYIEQCGSARAGSSNGSLKPLWRATPAVRTFWGRLKGLFTSQGTESAGPGGPVSSRATRVV
jgi:hypothetical protein